MRVVIDTNVVASAFLSPKGTPARLIEQWRREAFQLLVSEVILTEYERALNYERVRARHGMTAQEIAEVAADFRQVAVLVAPKERLSVIPQDEADNRFLECAVTGAAEYVVSGDAHMLALKEYREIQILSPAEFLALLRQQN